MTLGDEGDLPLLRAAADTCSHESADAWSVQPSPRREEATICAQVASRDVYDVDTKSEACKVCLLIDLSSHQTG